MWWMLAAPALGAPGDFVEPDAEAIWWVEEPANGSFGWVTAGLEDIDGDGVKEVIVGAPQAPGGGFTAVLSGADGSEIYRFSEAANAHGVAVADAGDVNGDGVHDIVAGAAGSGPGRVYVYSGADGSLLLDVPGEAAGDRFGDAVGSLGDIDGDGRSELLVGATRNDAGGTDGGRVYVLSGADGAVRVTVGGAAGMHLGAAIHRVGDIDGDGIADFAAGAPDAGAGAQGEVWVISGANGSLLLDPLGPGAATGFDLGLYFVGGPGDLDGDDVPDIYGADFAGNGQGGLVFVWSGADGTPLISLQGSDNEGLGCGRGAGDVDGDGIPDLAVGSWADSTGANQAGKVTVFSGADGSVLATWTSTEAGENFGFDAEGIGDVDGDGGIDIVTSGATLDRVYVLRGPVPEPSDTDDPDTDTDTGSDPDESGCGCATTGGAGWLVLALGALALRRRRAGRTGAGRSGAGTDP